MSAAANATAAAAAAAASALAAIEAQLPNPLTPLAFLPPSIARETEVARYVLVAALGVMVWDILSNVSNDFKLLFRHRVGLPTGVYFLSRLGALMYTLLSVIFETFPLGQGNCETIMRVIGAFYAVAVPFTCLLFFFRVRAIFNSDKIIVGGFFIVWLSVFASCLTIWSAVPTVNIGPTAYCLQSGLKAYAGSAVITAMVHDTLVFCAISWRLLLNSNSEYDMKKFARGFVAGESLPRFSKALLQDGQAYYLITVASNILTLIMVYVTSVPASYRVMFSAPNIVISNIMACYVFRSTRLGLMRDSPNVTANAMSGALSTGSIPLTLRRPVMRAGGMGSDRTLRGDEANVADIMITKTVDETSDYYTTPMEVRGGKGGYIV